MCETLRLIGTLINKVDVSELPDYVTKVTEACKLFFNLFSLFFHSRTNSTVWTMGYAVPYHVDLLHKKYGIGYGVISMQGKESKNSEMKSLLKNNTNRNDDIGGTNKWFQVMRNNFVTTFYLPYHFPIKPYVPHYTSRLPVDAAVDRCECLRRISTDETKCCWCKSCESFLGEVKEGRLPELVLEVIKPIVCPHCTMRFSDLAMRDLHMEQVHPTSQVVGTSSVPIAASVQTPSTDAVVKFDHMKVAELKKCCFERGLSQSGSKPTLVMRLNSYLF